MFASVLRKTFRCLFDLDDNLFKEDLLELTKIHEIILLEQLAYQL